MNNIVKDGKELSVAEFLIANSKFERWSQGEGSDMNVFVLKSDDDLELFVRSLNPSKLFGAVDYPSKELHWANFKYGNSIVTSKCTDEKWRERIDGKYS